MNFCKTNSIIAEKLRVGPSPAMLWLRVQLDLGMHLLSARGPKSRKTNNIRVYSQAH